MEKELENILNKAFDYGVQATLDNLLLRGYNTKAMLKQEYFGKRLDDALDEEKKQIATLLKNDIIKTLKR